MNIYDIPIALITQQYLETIELMQELNLDVAGEFLVMAATLIHIKSKMLLPRPETAAGRGRGGGPARRAGAPAARAPEVQGGRRAAARARAGCAPRSGSGRTERVAEIAGDETLRAGARGRSLQPAGGVSGVVERAKLRPKVLLPPEEVPVEVRIEQLLAMLSETEACGFEELFAQDDTRRGLIVTFLALLEMIRLKLVRVFQAAAFGPIRVYKRARPADAPTPIGDPGADRGD